MGGLGEPLGDFGGGLGPKRGKSDPKVTQRDQNGSTYGAKVAPREPKWSQKVTKKSTKMMPQNTWKKTHAKYLQKAPQSHQK